jgi:hypothetical protein
MKIAVETKGITHIETAAVAETMASQRARLPVVAHGRW